MNELGRAFSELDDEVAEIVGSAIRFRPKNHKLDLQARRLRHDMERIRVEYAEEMGADV